MMGQSQDGYNDEGVEVDLYDDDDGSITIIHDTDQSRDEILAASSSHSHHREAREALHNLNLSVIRKPEKEVTFSNIKVRTYPICVGDNPACSDGVPLAIAWQYRKEYNFTVDYYERKLEKWAVNPDSPMHPNRYPRKTEDDLRISARDRLQLLFSSGVKPQEANEAFRQVEEVRRNRAATVRSLHLLQLMYAWEMIQRAARNATVGRAAKQKERLMLQPYRNMQDDSVEINVDAVDVGTPRRWFTFRQSDQNSALKVHKRKKPAPLVVNQSYETASVATNTPQSVVSFNGDALFPPTPTSGSPLAKTIRERNMAQFEPRVIDMTGQVFSSYDSNAPSPIARSPTMKRTNKPKDRGFDDTDEDDNEFLIGESIMDRSMDYSSNVDRYAPAPNASISSKMDEGSNHSGNGYFNFRQSDWSSVTGGLSVASGSHHSRKNDNTSTRNDNVSAMSDSNSSISKNIRQLTGIAMGRSNDDPTAERGYFLDSQERYY